MSEQEYDRTNRWALFKNDRLQSDKSPTYTGSINVDGKDYYLNGWIRDGAKGKFFSGTIKPKDAPQQSAMPPRGKMTVTSGKQAPDPFDDGDSIPF